MSEGATSVDVDLQDLTKRFGSHRAVDHLSLQVYEGEILALLAVDAVRTAILSIGLGLSPRVTSKSGCDELLGESSVPSRIKREADICAAGGGCRIEDAAVGVDLQHVRRSCAVDSQIAPAKARGL